MISFNNSARKDLFLLYIGNDEPFFKSLVSNLEEDFYLKKLVRCKTTKEAVQALTSGQVINLLIWDHDIDLDEDKLGRFKEQLGEVSCFILLSDKEYKKVKYVECNEISFFSKASFNQILLQKSICFQLGKRENEAVLSHHKNSYKKLFNLSPQPMWLFDLETHFFLDVNQAAVHTYGYSKEEFLTMNIVDIRPKESVAEFHKKIKLYQEQKQGKIKDFFLHQKKNGDIITVKIFSNLITHNGRACRIAIAQDVSKEKKYIHKVRTQNRKLRKIAWMQSHLIRAPLTRIMSLSQMVLYENPRKPERERYLKNLLNSADELDTIVREIVKETEEIGKQL